MPTNPQRFTPFSQQSTPETTTSFVARPQSTEAYREQIAQNAKLRELCRCVSEEMDSDRMKILLDELYLVLDERELLASLL